MKMRNQLSWALLCLFALAACGGAENEAAAPGVEAQPSVQTQPSPQTPSAPTQPAVAEPAAAPVQSGIPTPSVGPAPAACSTGVVTSAFNGSQQEWLSGTTAQGTDGVHYWFSQAHAREACACAGCTADRCQAAESAPSHTICR